jgi:hypothetical protein
MDSMYGFYPHGIHNPFIKEIKSDENNTLVFDGYFYIDSKDLPVQRIMVKFGEESIDENRNTYRVECSDMHIEIYEKISGEDTSFYSKSDQINISDDIDNDDWDDNICFFPTEITTLKYRILKTNLTKLERDMLLTSIKESEKEREKKRINELTARFDE